MRRNVQPPKIGDKVWIVIPEHWYPPYLYPEFENADIKVDAAPAEAEIKGLSFFDKITTLKPTIVCVSHLRGNANNLHYVHYPSDIGKILFWNKEDCIKKCEELADIDDAGAVNRYFGYKRIRPWRKYEKII